MKTYTITYLISDDFQDENIRVKSVKAHDASEAWDKVGSKEAKTTWLLSVFEGKHKDLSKEIE